MSTAIERSVEWHADRPPVTVRLHTAAADRSAGATLILAHGAGAGLSHPFMVTVAEYLSLQGVDVLTFNFPYKEQGRRLPDPASVLESCYLRVVAFTRQAPRIGGQPIFLGGKSLGGRIASHLAAFHAATAGPLSGLVFLGYPLHPPGRPGQRRDSHLEAIRAPMLFVQGTRDTFGTPAELREALAPLTTSTHVIVVEQGDHSFGMPRSAGTTRDVVLAQVSDGVADWIRARVR